MSTDDLMKYKLYLRDLGSHLRKYAHESVAELEAHRGEDNAEFYSGKVIACHRFVSLMQQQAEAFEIPQAELKLDGIVPDRDLTGGSRRI